MPQTLSDIFGMILCLCKRLVNLDFCDLDYRLSTICTFNLSSTNCMSSSLTTLKMRVKTSDDCLYVLDGRLDCLSTLIITVKEIFYASTTINNTVSKIAHCSVLRNNSESNVSPYFILFS